MPSCWGKSSSTEDKRKANTKSFIDKIKQKLRRDSEEKCKDKSGGSGRRGIDTVSEKGCRSLVPPRSPSQSAHMSRCRSFEERPHAQPLPQPGLLLSTISRTRSASDVTSKPDNAKGVKPSLFLPLPKPGCAPNSEEHTYAEEDIATASVSSYSFIDSDDPYDSSLPSPLTYDWENGNRSTFSSSFSKLRNDQAIKEKSKAYSNPAPQLCNNTSPKGGPLYVQNLQIVPPCGLCSAAGNAHQDVASGHCSSPLYVQNLQIIRSRGSCSAPDSSMSSAFGIPTRSFGGDEVLDSGSWAGKAYQDVPSGHSSSPVSGHNSIGGDFSGQIFWPQSRCSPESSPITSPRMTSPGRSCRIHGGAGGPAIESPTRQTHRLLLPPTTIAYSAATTPSVPSGHCSSPVSGHNSVGGDFSGQIFWPQSRCSPESSPITSPRMTSPGRNCRIHSGAGGPATESPTRQTHRLPLHPTTIAYSAATTPSGPHSPSRAENSSSTGSCWKKGKLLGRGTFGHVYCCFNSKSGEIRAMKEVTLFPDDAKSRKSAQLLGEVTVLESQKHVSWILQEIAMLSRLRHPNIVQYYGSEMVDDKLRIYLEYVSGGSIYKLLQENGQFGEIYIRNYTRQILMGLAYLHAKNTVHRDIKAANILVDPSGLVKLADFGLAKLINGQPCSLERGPYWMAPEVIKKSNGFSLAVDIWSLGCTVLEMATTKPPWSQYAGVAAMFKIGNSKELPAIPDHLSEQGKRFVRLCLQRNPLHRPTAAKLLDHPFVKYKYSTLEKPIVLDTAGKYSSRSLKVSPSGSPLTHSRATHMSGRMSPSPISSPPHTASASSTPSNLSGPLSPSWNTLLHSRATHTSVSGRMSPSPISSPYTTSGSSTPLIGDSGPILFHQVI